MYKIYQFSRENGEGEFIVISEESRDDVLAEWMEDGYSLDREYTIKEDATLLPCDRRLRHNLS